MNRFFPTDEAHSLHALFNLVKLMIKIVRAKTNGQNISNFQNLTLKIINLSFFVKFKTSPGLTPYYSTELSKLYESIYFNIWSPECLIRFAALAGKFHHFFIIFVILVTFWAQFSNISNFQFSSIFWVPQAFKSSFLNSWSSQDL